MDSNQTILIKNGHHERAEKVLNEVCETSNDNRILGFALNNLGMSMYLRAAAEKTDAEEVLRGAKKLVRRSIEVLERRQ